MKKLLILSGKGGTGKTTVASAFIGFGNIDAFCDCDVDAPNLHLVQSFKNEPLKSDFIGADKAEINSTKCSGCGLCYEHCRFDAVKKSGTKYEIDEYACEGCGVCERLCPDNAITLNEDIAGKLMLYKENKVFSTARLKMGRGNSGKLVTEVKKQLILNSQDKEIAVIDGSPGIGCPVIASTSGVDMVLIVAESSLSGISDMQRIIRTISSFHLKLAVCINKYDNCPEQSEKIENFCTENNIPFVGKIPFDKEVSKAINNGKNISMVDCPAKTAVYEIYKKTISILKG